jgi:D-alanyl-D-alanine endopeptidase (penicillin-binding protein 7)
MNFALTHMWKILFAVAWIGCFYTEYNDMPDARPVRVAHVQAAPAQIVLLNPHEQMKSLPAPVVLRATLITSKDEFLSGIVEIFDVKTNAPVFQKNSTTVTPIASISKLMTAMVLLDMGASPDKKIKLKKNDIDTVKFSSTKLTPGQEYTRLELIKLALIRSENPAAHALARTASGGLPLFIDAMNKKCLALGMLHTHFVEPTGLNPLNVSTAEDLAKMVLAAEKYSVISEIASTTIIKIHGIVMTNTNALFSNDKWDIHLSKTGFINESGRCVAMLTTINARRLVVILLNGASKEARAADELHINKLHIVTTAY